MKNNVLKYLLLLCISITAHAQVLPLYPYSVKEVNNAYYQDIDSVRNQFVGTWVYNNGNEQMKIRFRKLDHFLELSRTYSYHLDYLIGEMQYKNSVGIEKFNSLANLNANHQSIHKYSMFSGSYQSNRDSPQCLNCTTNTRRLFMWYNEPDVDDLTLKGEWAMRVVIENGITKLKVQYKMHTAPIGFSKFDSNLTASKTKHDFPYGDYTFIKE